MANEIQCAHRATGKTLYALIRNATGSVWNGTSFVAYATANLWTYTVYLTEQGTASRYYTGTFPSVAAGVYNIAVYERPGGSAAEGDPLAATGSIDWDGSSVTYLDSRPRGSDYTAARAAQLDNLDAAITSRLAGAAYVEPDNVGIAAIQGQTDQLSFDGSGWVHAHTNVNDDKTGYECTVLGTVEVGINNDKTGYALTPDYDPAKTAAQAGDAMNLAADAVDAAALAGDAVAEIVAGILDGTIETSFSLQEALRLMLAALAGKLAGAATTTVTIRDVNDTTNRITATVDADGNRTAVTLDAS